MTTFRFSLEQILVLRRQKVRQAEIRLGNVQRQRQQCQRAMHELRLEIEAGRGMGERGPSALASPHWDASYRQFEAMHARLMELQTQSDDLTRQWREAKGDYERLERERQVLEKVRERQQRAFDQEQLRRTYLELDDLVLQQRARRAAIHHHGA